MFFSIIELHKGECRRKDAVREVEGAAYMIAEQGSLEPATEVLRLSVRRKWKVNTGLGEPFWCTVQCKNKRRAMLGTRTEMEALLATKNSMQDKRHDFWPLNHYLFRYAARLLTLICILYIYFFLLADHPH